MDGFRTVRATRHQGQRRRPRHGAGTDARTGRRRRNGQRHLRGPAHPGVERRAVVRGLDGADREPAGQPPGSGFTSFTSLDARRHRRRRVGRRHPPRRRRPEQHHDGRHLGHGHGQQRPDAQHERRVDRRGQGPDPGLPGGVRPVERPADHGRHQERHQPLPRLGLRLSRSTPTGTRTAGSTQKNGDPKPVNKRDIYGYSIGGPVGKPGGNNKLFFFYSHEYRPTNAAINSGNPIRLRVPTALERAGDFSQTLDNNGALFNVIRDHQTGLTCSATSTAAASRTAASSAGFRRTVCISTGLAMLNRYPLPNIAAGGRARTTTTRWMPPAVENLHAAAGDPARLPAVVEAARHRQVLGRARAPADDARAHPGLHRRLQSQPVHHQLRGDGQLRDHARRPSSKARTGSSATSWSAATRAASSINESANRLTVAAGLPAALSRRRRRRSPLLRERSARTTSKPAVLGRQLDQPAAGLHLGRPHRRRAAEPALSRLAQHQPHAGRRDQLDEGRRPPHASRAASTTTTATRRRTSAPAAA